METICKEKSIIEIIIMAKSKQLMAIGRTVFDTWRVQLEHLGQIKCTASSSIALLQDVATTYVIGTVPCKRINCIN